MLLATIRTRLVDQHAQLRARIATLLDAAETLSEHDPKAGLLLRTRLAELSDALERHNREEERLLSSLIPKLDAWGNVRKRIMDERHAGEHEAQLGALRSIVDIHPLEASLDAMRRCLQALVDHIAHEERDVLNPDVLRDDCYAVDAVTD